MVTASLFSDLYKKTLFYAIEINILQQGDPIEERYKEHLERGPVIDQLIYCISSYREAAMSNDPKFDHIDLADKQKVSSGTLPFPIKSR